VNEAVLLLLVDDVPDGDGWLTPEERQEQSRLRFPKRRRDWRLGRWAAKRAVSAATGAATTSVRVTRARSGAPEAWVEPPAGKGAALLDRGPDISLSHAGGRGLCAVAPHRVTVGCDLEQVEARSPAFVSEWLTPAEQDLVEQAGPAHDLVATLLWSAKESALKVLQEGLRLPTRTVEVELTDGPPHPSVPARWRSLRLTVTGPEGPQRWGGWWRTEGPQVMTVVADRQTAPPNDWSARPGPAT
jgi:4'-phosphopantetheinyl transferase